MHKVLIGGIASLVLTVTGAHAGDLPFPGGACGGPCAPMYPPPPPPMPIFCWCGPYIGFNLGDLSAQVTNSGARPSGFTGGFQGGFNWQFGQWVTGWEADFQFDNAEDTFGSYKFSLPWFGTVRARGGMAFDNVLLYGTVGAAYGQGRVDAFGLSETTFHVGWTAGAGVELGLTRNLSVKIEYLRVDLASEQYVLTATDNGISSNVVRAGVNFHF
jgi:outer membrane immunogenic protein